jgi:hypothetical protein
LVRALNITERLVKWHSDTSLKNEERLKMQKSNDPSPAVTEEETLEIFEIISAMMRGEVVDLDRAESLMRKIPGMVIDSGGTGEPLPENPVIVTALISNKEEN